MRLFFGFLELPVVCPPPRATLLVPKSGKYAPFPLSTPSLCADQPQASPPRQVSASVSPTPNSGPSRLFRPAPPGRELADATWVPAPRPPPCSGFWLHAPLPRAAPGCASRFAPQPPGAPQPEPWGGREGARAGGAGLRQCSPGPRPPFCACPSPRRPSPTCASVRSSCRGLLSVTVAGLNLSAQCTGEVWAPPPPTPSEGVGMQQGRGASRTWPEVPTPSLARVSLAQTRHCWGVRWGLISSFL